MATYTVSVEVKVKRARLFVLRYLCAPIIATLRDCGVDVSEMVDALYAQMLDCAEYRIDGGMWRKLNT